MGRQHTEQSSTCCCSSTDKSSVISIDSQQYGHVIVSNWIKRRLAIALGLQPLPSPAARVETVGISRVELALVAHPLVKAILPFDPQLDGFEPESESAPVIGAHQAVGRRCSSRRPWPRVPRGQPDRRAADSARCSKHSPGSPALCSRNSDRFRQPVSAPRALRNAPAVRARASTARPRRGPWRRARRPCGSRSSYKRRHSPTAPAPSAAPCARTASRRRLRRRAPWRWRFGGPRPRLRRPIAQRPARGLRAAGSAVTT